MPFITSIELGKDKLIGKKQGILFDLFIKAYTFMHYETAKHRGRQGQANQPGGGIVKGISIKFKGNRMYEGRVWDIAATGISLCARGREVVEDTTSSRRERTGDGKIACKHDQPGSEIKQKDQRKHQWDHNRSVKDLLKKTWSERKIIDRLSSSMSSIGCGNKSWNRFMIFCFRS